MFIPGMAIIMEWQHSGIIPFSSHVDWYKLGQNHQLTQHDESRHIKELKDVFK